MFHLFVGEKKQQGNQIFLQNQFFGIQVQYSGNRASGEFFIYPHLDDNKKTIVYFAFDTAQQKSVFEDMLKISGVGPKTAFHIAQLPSQDIQDAIQNLDAKFFQAIPGVGPKSAKKMLLELKGSFSFQEVKEIDDNQKYYKDIVKSLKNFGYDTEKIKAILQSYPQKITKETMSEVIKWVIGNM